MSSSRSRSSNGRESDTPIQIDIAAINDEKKKEHERRNANLNIFPTPEQPTPEQVVSGISMLIHKRVTDTSRRTEHLIQLAKKFNLELDVLFPNGRIDETTAETLIELDEKGID